MTQRSLVIFQSGGPTAVLNASLVGAILAGRKAGYKRILGARHGVEGLLESDIVDLTHLDDVQLSRLRMTPSAALGMSRHRPDADECRQIINLCNEEGIDSIVAIGGNDTADTAWRLVKQADSAGSGLKIISVPKTIDNDLVGTDHSLGYGSAARFLALAVRDSTFDTLAGKQIYPIKIIEVMGRNAGWLAAAGTLAFPEALPPPIICLPERRFDGPDTFCGIVEQRLDQEGYAIIVAPETMRWSGGGHVAGETPEWVDPFGHPYFPSAGNALSRLLIERLGVKARFDKPGSISRMAMHAASDVDLAEAEQCGVEAVRLLDQGKTGMMVSLKRISSQPYRVKYATSPVSQVANAEWLIPGEMIGEDGISMTGAFRDYAMPLLGAPFEEYQILD